ncbi:MAG: cysteine peptidase family C39 domain-containing protein, partial [Holophagales bacterium]|nr:cysteine peptidase family C39 domain-containing protein [Holophagales bacterium]
MGDSTGRSLTERFPALHDLTARRQRRLRYVQQTTSSDCGAACLAMVLSYHGKDLPLAEVRELVGVDRDGSDALAILDAARWLGLRGRGVQVEGLEDLRYLEPGAILHWRFDHFVVLERWTPKGAVVLDPAGGRRRVPTEELGTSVTGVALVFQPAEDFEPGRRATRGIRRYLQPIFEQWGQLGRILTISVLVQVFA